MSKRYYRIAGQCPPNFARGTDAVWNGQGRGLSNEAIHGKPGQAAKNLLDPKDEATKEWQRKRQVGEEEEMVATEHICVECGAKFMRDDDHPKVKRALAEMGAAADHCPKCLRAWVQEDDE